MLTFVKYIAESLVGIVVGGMPTTIYITVYSFFLGLLLGLLISVIKLKKVPIANGFLNIYVSFMRGTPPLVQLFIIYFGLPMLLKQLGIDCSGWDKSVFAIITLALMNAAYIAKAIMSSYLSVERGQIEAGISIGMGSLQLFRRVLLPQTLVIAVPNLGNILIILIKQTALAFTIGIIDMMGVIKVLDTRSYGARKLELYIAVAILYWLLCFMIQVTFDKIEKRLKRGYQGIK